MIEVDVEIFQYLFALVCQLGQLSGHKEEGT